MFIVKADGPRLKSIMLSNFPIVPYGNSFLNPPIIVEIIPTKIALLSNAERNNRIFGLFVRNGDIRMFSSQ